YLLLRDSSSIKPWRHHMLNTLQNLLRISSRRPRRDRMAAQRPRTQLAVEQLEDRCVLSVAFALSADHQVRDAIYDTNGQLTRSWMMVAPGQFSAIATGTYGPQNSAYVFGLGMDHHIYAARFNADGTLANGWFLVGPGVFSSLTVTSVNGNGGTA